jgi:hypothetical protein
MAKLEEVIQQLIDRIQELEDEVYGNSIDSDGNRVYTYEYPIPDDVIMFTPSDTYNAPSVELSYTIVDEYRIS